MGSRCKQFFRKKRYWQSNETDEVVSSVKPTTDEFERYGLVINRQEAKKKTSGLDGVDEELLNEFLIFRLVIEGLATLKELETYYSFDDALRMTAILDIKAQIERVELEKVKK